MPDFRRAAIPGFPAAPTPLERRAVLHQDPTDEFGFSFDVGFAIAWIARRQCVLEVGVCFRFIWVRAQMIPKYEVVAPQIAAADREVDMILARYPSPEKVSARYALL